MAFPRAWRERILERLHSAAGVRDGAYALAASILEWKVVEVTYGSRGRALLRQGVPEGGAVGPATYTQVSDTLVRRLVAAGHGIGVGERPPYPPAWRGY